MHARDGWLALFHQFRRLATPIRRAGRVEDLDEHEGQEYVDGDRHAGRP